MPNTRAGSRHDDRIDTSWDYEVCAWARHFNTSQQRVREAVQAVGNRAERVRAHLAEHAQRGGAGPGERPSAR
ncbi:DUF3606 domain-containing protein [Ramlibacter sp.]|uniref:DUF3606 domain-containing protein n=1 Tax=Ramlibacter sp. TaxID=1917967 RepID=UPI002C13B1AD|nr:DUF3606 domain-containing protein [Ramlibacter sp.]HWI81066.1 DUF3606 domain-containing protein [Ramlibacter sp.]